MRGQRTRALWLVAALGVTLALSACGGKAATNTTGSAASTAPIKIGAVVSLTGTYAGLGAPEQAVIELEVARINKAGGINGRQIEVIFEDDGTDEAKAVAAASKLISQDKVIALIGASGTGQTMAMRAEADKAGIPQVSMAGGTAVTQQFDKLVFQTPWSNTIVVPFVLDYLKSQSLSKVGLITDSGAYGKDGKAIIEAEAPKYGIEITDKETFNPGDTDMTSQLTKIKSSGATAILMWTAGKEASTIAKNRQQLSMAQPLVGGSGIARTQFIEGAGEAANGVVFGTGKSLMPESWGTTTENYAVVKDFSDRFAAANKGVKPDIFAGHAYDAINIIADAMKRLPADFTSAQLRDEIEKTDGFVGFGGLFTFTATDHNGLSADDLTMYRITDGVWTLDK